MSTNAKDLFAKLLATENIKIKHGAFDSAYFDTEKRILGLPRWNVPVVADMLIGHEVGHALYTPNEGWKHVVKHGIASKDYYNVVEDVRIERLIQEKFPGMRQSFIRGYRYLQQIDLFGVGRSTVLITLDKYNFIDRLNIKAKLRSLIDVEFNDDELPYVDMAHAANTWAEVVAAAEAIYLFCKDRRENEESASSGLDAYTVIVKIKANVGSPATDEAPGGIFDEQEIDVEVTDKPDGNPEEDEDAKTGDSGTPDAKPENPEKPEKDSTEDGIADNAAGNEAGIRSTPQDLSLESTIDKTIEDGLKTLVDTDGRGNVIAYLDPPPQEVFDRVISYFAETQSKRSMSFSKRALSDSDSIGDVKKFADEHKAVINSMVKEFETRKSASLYSRAKISKTGSIDLKRLHQYRTSDDIFLRTTKLAEGKNHGIVMLIDYSGSMSEVMRNVLVQTLQLAMFCKKTNIPFQVFGFSDVADASYNSFRSYSSRNKNEPWYDSAYKGVKVFEVLSSSLNKADYKLALAALVKVTRMSSTYYHTPGGYERLGGTPLNAALLIMPKILRDFRNKHNIEKLSFVSLTDGDSNNVGLGEAGYDFGDGNIVKNSTTDMVKSLKNYGADNTTNFFLVSNWTSNYFSRALFQPAQKNIDRIKANSMFTKNKVHALHDSYGYDVQIYIKGSSRMMSGSTEELKLDNDATPGKIVSAFKKHSKSKAGNRVVVSEFIKVVA
jgi:Mg-chelatase subunit ChlD